MVQISKLDNKGIDFSIMPTLECNLRCPFCMYDCSPDSKQQIDLAKLEIFLYSIPKGTINSYGLYGGEPSINIRLYENVIALLPIDASIFIITNGTWTKSPGIDFIEFVINYNLHCFISSTPNHLMFQDAVILRNVLRSYSNFTVKEDDTQKRMLPMGRNMADAWYCTKRCLNNKKPRRFAVMPNGDIIFQSCNGVYPVVGSMSDPFCLSKYEEAILNCREVYYHDP